MIKKLLQKTKEEENGQAIVEFALVLPLLLLIICGILDFGWIYVNQYKVQSAAYAGARYASIKAEELSTSDLIENISIKASENLFDGGKDAVVSVELNEKNVSVTVEYPVKTLTFLANALFGAYYNASSTSVSTY